MSSEELREANLDAMSSELALRLREPLPDSRLGVDDDGAPTWTRFRRPRLLRDAHCMERIQQCSVEGPPIILLGLGAGQRLAWLLENTRRVVISWDPDHAIWQYVLGVVDGADAIREGRWKPLLGPDLLHFRVPPESERHWHPDFRAAYADAESMLQPEGPVALMVQGELYVDDVAEGLRALGWRVFRWDVAYLPTAEHAHILATTGARMALAVNTQEGLAEALRSHNIPFAVWEIDPNTSGPAPVHGPCDQTVVFTYRQHNLPALRRAGYRHVEHLPLAAPTHRYRPSERVPTVPIAFVGASMAESGQRMQATIREMLAHEPSTLASLERVWAIQRQDPSRWIIPKILESVCPGLRARVRRTHAGVDLALLMGEVSAAEKRLSWLSHLGPLGLQVWGDAGWSLTLAHGVSWNGWADHFTDLPKIYASAAIHVDVPRLYQQDAVAMRIFDVMSAGGFLVAEHSPQLLELFRPGVELETYRTPAELVDKCRFYLQQPERRQAIAQAGCERVHRDHSIRVRVGQMVERLGLSALASPGPSGPRSP
ncbi:MAG: hypothetical protein CL927_14610 [Deltaproteobacteria bacterium]|nr:hypothetical protein [Deltaproteobacteria bacterium]